MNIINKLSSSINNENDLDLFLNNHIQDLHEFCLRQSYSQLIEHKSEIEIFFSSKYKYLKSLDVNDNLNYSLLVLLLELCDRLGLVAFFRRLYSLLTKSSYGVSLKFEAVALYSLGIRNVSDYNSVYDDIIRKLSEACEFEEDDINDIITRVAQLYSKIVGDFCRFNSEAVNIFRDKLKHSQVDYPFLKHSLLDEVLKIDISNYETAYSKIQSKIDFFLSRDKIIIVSDINTLLIESDTSYSMQLNNSNRTFDGIRSLCVDLCTRLSEDVYYSLGRGVNILTEESQLPMYIKSYGNAHYAKILSALEVIDFQNIIEPIEIVDWGCGQALATVILLEYIQSKGIKVNNIILIDPSEIALKRGALHVSHMNSEVKINTICKKLDSLCISDIGKNKTVRVNLFSNILDIEEYNQTELIKLIGKIHQGLNYFVCVSPDINEIKSGRLSSFSSFFENNYSESFNMLADYRNGGSEADEYWCCNNKFKGIDIQYCNHVDCGCRRKWTRVVKVFNVELS